MPYNKNKEAETIQKTLRIPADLANKIDNLCVESERDFTKQVIFMLKKYIELIESK